MQNSNLFEPLQLPNGVVIKNRFFKSAMNEGLGNKKNQPNQLHNNLYKIWAEGGTGLLMTGNVMIDRNALGEPRNVVVEDEQDLEFLQQWAEAGKINDTHIWMQINHPGKQSPKTISKIPLAPSAIPVSGEFKSAFNTPRALTIDEIKDIIRRFINTARIAKKAGFTGVQIHGAHGYLINQFLSPFDNRRTDEYGGSLENRMRILVEIYTGIRKEVGAEFPVALKLNSSDFKQGGFSKEDSLIVVQKMADLGLDLIEISGGSYENPKMSEGTGNDSIFFIDYAVQLRKLVNIPIVVTGGFRSVESMEEAISLKKTDMIGIARPLAIIPDIPNQILSGEYKTYKTQRLTTGFKKMDKKLGALIGNIYYEQQMKRIAKGLLPEIHTNAWKPLLYTISEQGLSMLTPRRSR